MTPVDSRSEPSQKVLRRSFLGTIAADWKPLMPHQGSLLRRVTSLVHQILCSSGVHALFILRLSHLFYRFHLWPLAYLCRKIIYHGYHMDIWGQTEVGPGHWWPHPISIVYSRHAVIGFRVKVYHQVSIVSGPGGAPVIGDFAYLFAGCCVMGGVRVGRGATIGAHALVVKDVPDYAVVVGNPARILRYRTEEEIDEEDTEWRSNPNVRPRTTPVSASSS